jgi:hypothetical protein
MFVKLPVFRTGTYTPRVMLELALARNDKISRTKEKILSALPFASASTLFERTCLKDTYVNQAYPGSSGVFGSLIMSQEV